MRDFGGWGGRIFSFLLVWIVFVRTLGFFVMYIFGDFIFLSLGRRNFIFGIIDFGCFCCFRYI